MDIKETLEYINNYTWSKSRLGLGRTRTLLDGLGNPQNKLKFVHVAGSNGKGSTCAMIESVLRTAGYKTGLYPSPYIEDFKESFQVCGEYISDNELCEITQQVRLVADEMEDHPSQFEIKTAIAMLFYLHCGCDIVVLETGMGGELDSTNVIAPPEAAVITNICFEHTQYLGNTLTEIASAKAGIIKSGSPVVSYDNDPEVMTVLKSVCAKKGCGLYTTHESDVKKLGHNLDGQSFMWNKLTLQMPLLGSHQLKNAAVALKTLEILRNRGYKISDVDIITGFENVKWPARFEVLSKQPLFILDGGHNAQCARALADILRDYLPDVKFTFIFGVLADKNYEKMISAVERYASEFICVTPPSERALSGDELAKIIRGRGLAAHYEENIPGAVLKCIAEGKNTLAFGSLYMAGEIRKEIRNLNE